MRDYLASFLPSPRPSCRISGLPISYSTATNCYPCLNGPFTPTDQPTDRPDDPPPSDYKLDRRGYTCLGSLLTHRPGLKGSLIVGTVMNAAQTKLEPMCILLQHCLYHYYDVYIIMRPFDNLWTVDRNALLLCIFNKNKNSDV